MGPAKAEGELKGGPARVNMLYAILSRITGAKNERAVHPLIGIWFFWDFDFDFDPDFDLDYPGFRLCCSRPDQGQRFGAATSRTITLGAPGRLADESQNCVV